jgi:uncharacterized protein YdaU (DUF1376 family)
MGRNKKSYRYPWFPFYPNDWLSSQNVMAMSPAEEGAYLRLLALEWMAEDCDLPADQNELAAMSRLGEGWFKGGSGDRILRNFEPSKKEGRIVNQRLLSERKDRKEWSDKSADGGVKSGESRRNKAKGGSTTLQPLPQPNTNNPDPHPDPHPDPEIDIKTGGDVIRTAAPPLVPKPITAPPTAQKVQALHPDAEDAFRTLRTRWTARMGGRYEEKPGDVERVSDALRDGRTRADLETSWGHYLDARIAGRVKESAFPIRDWVAEIGRWLKPGRNGKSGPTMRDSMDLGDGRRMDFDLSTREGWLAAHPGQTPPWEARR